VQADARTAWDGYVADDVTVVAVPDARVALAEAAAGLYEHPARGLGMVGVTGTDGKTTTTHLIAHVLSATETSAGYLSSVAFGVRDVTEQNVSHMTTLEASDVQRYLAQTRDAGGRYAVVEASSIGLDLHRVDQCDFDVAVFTNLTRDHLDYHKSMEAYAAAKARLFAMLDASPAKAVAQKAAILNADDPASETMRAATSAPAMTYGVREPAAVAGRDIPTDGFGTRFAARMGGENAAVRMGLLGAYNVSNALAAVATAVSQGTRFGEAVHALESFPGVPGRMELIDKGQPFRVVIDIASTEQAMRNVLEMLRPLTTGKLIVVFGAAGERDPGRRTGIARAVAACADFADLTNEDPRSEDPDEIIEQIAGGLRAAGWEEERQFVRKRDRRAAIELAFGRAKAGDTVLLAGKGTEPSIVIGTEHVPWDERTVARELLGRAASV